MGGGVCLYVKSRFQANACDNLALDDEETDCFSSKLLMQPVISLLA